MGPLLEGDGGDSNLPEKLESFFEGVQHGSCYFFQSEGGHPRSSQFGWYSRSRIELKLLHGQLSLMLHGLHESIEDLSEREMTLLVGSEHGSESLSKAQGTGLHGSRSIGHDEPLSERVVPYPLTFPSKGGGNFAEDGLGDGLTGFGGFCLQFPLDERKEVCIELNGS